MTVPDFKPLELTEADRASIEAREQLISFHPYIPLEPIKPEQIVVKVRVKTAEDMRRMFFDPATTATGDYPPEEE